mmetsp:Transcript_16450/g.35256  ORF Transcript_16450/g.35256 Transcript_16450/m.35256 type:complete len:290 (-) Transcript_16450:29-898(-)
MHFCRFRAQATTTCSRIISPPEMRIQLVVELCGSRRALLRHDVQHRGANARVRGRLALCWAKRALHSQRPATLKWRSPILRCIPRHLRRLLPRLLKLAEEVHHKSALRVLPSDDAQPASRLEQLKRSLQAFPQLAELVVQMDAQRLERELRGVHRLILDAFGTRHQSCELLGAPRKQALIARDADCICDTPGSSLIRRLAVLLEDADQLRSLDVLQKLPRGLALALVEAQVEWPVGLGTKPAVRFVKLWRGDAQIEECSRDADVLAIRPSAVAACFGERTALSTQDGAH